MYAYGPDCVRLVKASESCRLTAYKDPKGLWTIGWGHLLPQHQDWTGLTWTQDEADSWLVRQLAQAESSVNVLVKVPLTQGQTDALVDFVYNEGVDHLADSSLLKRLNVGDYTGAGGELRYWVYAGEVVEPGLVKRRAAEQALWNQPTAP